MKKSAIILIACMCCVSCIKEQREQCPCYLHVDLSHIDSKYVHKMDIMLADRLVGGTPEWTPVEKRHIGDTLILKVDKSEFDFSAWGNIINSVQDQNNHTITLSNPFDSLWSYSRTIQTRCEDAYVTVVAERQHIPLTIIVRGMLQGIEQILPVLDGINIGLNFSGAPAGNKVKVQPTLVARPTNEAPYYVYKTMIITQVNCGDAIFKLSFSRNGEPVELTYPLGEMLLEIGEDISARNQSPIVLDLTIGSASVLLNIKVNDWTSHGLFTITY